MRATNIRVVGSTAAVEGSEYDAVRAYLKKRREAGPEHESAWYDWAWIVNCYRRGFEDTPRPHLTAHVVSYNYGNSEHGLTRREALRILNKLKLRPPTAMETFRIATAEIQGKKLAEIIQANDRRRIMCAVPINPEFPEFYYFGRNQLHGEFARKEYNSIDECEPCDGKDLYFWPHYGGEMTAGFEYYFPLLLGIEK